MSVKLTPFGQFARKLRVDRAEYLKDMALRLNVTPTYLSAVERGRRNAPKKWVGLLQKAYNLSAEETAELERAVSESRVYDNIDIAHLSFDEKRLVEAIVEAIPKMSEKEYDELKSLIYKKR